MQDVVIGSNRVPTSCKFVLESISESSSIFSLAGPTSTTSPVSSLTGAVTGLPLTKVPLVLDKSLTRRDEVDEVKIA